MGIIMGIIRDEEEHIDTKFLGDASTTKVEYVGGCSGYGILYL